MERIIVEMALENVYKKYDNAEDYSVTDFNLSIEGREFIVSVGPSGCRKPTTLRMTAGLEGISGGELNIDEKVMNDVAPKDRDIAAVFQNYALYPHMTVFDSTTFGLKLCKHDKANIKKRVGNVAEILGLTEYSKRKPAALSGGQRQRMALGRAIIRDTKVLLIDEPLSNLDAKLRVAMHAEITKLHQHLEITTIYVTHGQIETMTMVSRTVIMKDGFVRQTDTPKEAYDIPVNMFVVGFVGSPAVNFFNVTLKNGVITDGHRLKLRIPEGKNRVLVKKGYGGKEVIFGIRSEDIHNEQVALGASPEAVVKSEVVVSELLGAETMLYTKTDSTEFISKVDARDFHRSGGVIDLAFNISKDHFFNKRIEQVIKLP